jgi:hypothetical protein
MATTSKFTRLEEAWNNLYAGYIQAATSKFTRLEEAWNNLFAGYIQGVASTLVLPPSLEDEPRLSVGVLLMAVKCKLNAVNSCINTQRMNNQQ